jgi:sortase A
MVCGILMLSLYVAAQIHRMVLSKAELQRFKIQQISCATHHTEKPLGEVAPDFSLWSEHRIKDYEESLVEHFAPAIAILRIPKIHMEVPVLEGTDDLILNRGVGHVIGTAKPGEDGNVAIAGHRDGFFRGLKDIDFHDTIEVETMDRTERYTIDRITVVDPSDVSVLKKRSHASLTLITCYPFYFIGSAPKRYIVQASISDHAGTNDAVGRRHFEAEVSDENTKLTSNEF